MSDARKTRWLPLAAFALVAVLAVGGTWAALNRTRETVGASSNAIMVIAPYRHAGTWVFDDPAAGLTREPFVAGVPEMIDVLVKDIPEAEQGFRLLFSANPFPGHQKTLTWSRGDMGGNYYTLDSPIYPSGKTDPPMEGWICPAMFKYYDAPPESLYVKAEPLKR